MKTSELIFLPVEKLYPHPDNPRKDLGDLTELSDSIKVKGIMQNLTVVPKDKDTYTVIIGHRRLGASILAGIKEVPCVIADMSPKEQIAVMVAENMQRSDLTVYEEACGMQMMLDLGDTMEGVAEQIGLSKATVRRRVKLLELDKDKLKKSLERGATLADYEKLDKIKSEELKNKVLETIGTKNFNWELKKAIDDEKKQEREIEVISTLNTFAKPVEDTKALKLDRYISLSGTGEIETPEDAGTVKYFYKKLGSFIDLYREKTKEDISEEERRNKEQAKKEKKRNLIATLFSNAYELRKEFVKAATVTTKEQEEALLRFACAAFRRAGHYYGGIGSDYLQALLGDKNIKLEEIENGKSNFNPKRALLLMAYGAIRDRDIEKCADYENKFLVNEKLEVIYNFLEKLGYQMSEEEKALMDGTHKIYEGVANE